ATGAATETAAGTQVVAAATVTAATALPATPAASATPAAGLPAELLPWREKLLHLMEQEQPWLEPELTLTELAHRLRTNPGLLSKVINAGCGQNFNDFVNTYRVQEARRKLADARFAHYSLVGVALESGFNSKSTFNRVFRKVTGQAPSEVGRG
ncbi:MAG: helix-turn-helix transcriptional regulator, partial [Bacteroidota bacterium]|nr:helix-turn-helix transcriptional regulator [Bacteroidota bacterium]